MGVVMEGGCDGSGQVVSSEHVYSFVRPILKLVI